MSETVIKITNEKDAKDFFQKILPDSVRFSVANTCTRAVYSGMEASENEIRDDFILRGGYVVGKKPGRGAIKYDKAIPSHDIDKISARWGSVDKVGAKDYSFMQKQEEGFTNETKPVPDAATARSGGTEQGKVQRKNYINGADIKKLKDFASGLNGKSDIARRVIAMKRAYKQGYGLPGSSQFFSFDDDEYAAKWEGGLFQFGQNEPPRSGLRYPNVKRLYYNPEGKNKSKRRRAVRWMQKSKNKIKQTEIDKFYAEEMNKQLARQMKK
jgi:hypothetical protein